MKRLCIIIIGVLLTATASSQPSWTKKATKSVFTLKTFSADGTLIGSTNGFFTGEDGEAVSSFSPFKGASSAVVIDAQGKELPVACMLGANETYDVAKFRVAAKKTVPLTIAATDAAEGTQVWLLPYREMKQVPAGTVRKTETINTSYAYYTVAMTMPEGATSCPLMNDAGEVVGLMQQPYRQNDSLSYAVSARFADSLRINGLSINDATLRSTNIKKDLPADPDQAVLALYMGQNSLDSAQYLQLIDDFISRFPNSPDGYTYRAQTELVDKKFDDAARDMEQAIRIADKKDEAHFNYSKLIYQKEVYLSQEPYEPWSLDKALSEAREAEKLNPLAIYRHQQAAILFAQKKYGEAADIYNALFSSELRSPELFYEASRCKAAQKDTLGQIALLDSCLATFNQPYLKEAAPYLLARAQVLMDANQNRKAVTDLNEYEKLMVATVNDRFYYLRFQAEVGGRLFQQALNDIDQAIKMNPQYDLYYAEKASLQVRVGLYDEAIATANECVKIAPDHSDGYLFLGIAQCQKGLKAEGLKNLQKARELGDSQADVLIEKYSK
ncbi:MAG: tetratricopeptide repeat protein [Prevotella sp.]|nr:tetratricopeptide repeat protein [Prevotella sp.]